MQPTSGRQFLDPEEMTEVIRRIRQPGTPEREIRSRDEKAILKRLFGLGKIYDVEIGTEAIYGVLLLTDKMDDWFYFIGTWPYVFGVSVGANLLGEHDQGSDRFYNQAFVLLDEDKNPTAIIDSVIVPAELAPEFGRPSSKPAYYEKLTVIENAEVEPFDDWDHFKNE
jgi:hypothetical protein